MTKNVGPPILNVSFRLVPGELIKSTASTKPSVVCFSLNKITFGTVKYRYAEPKAPDQRDVGFNSVPLPFKLILPLPSICPPLKKNVSSLPCPARLNISTPWVSLCSMWLHPKMNTFLSGESSLARSAAAPGIGDKTATKIVKDPIKMQALLENKEKRNIFERNVNLIRLVDFSNDMSKLESKTGTGDWDMIEQTFEDLGFDSMLKEKTWTKYVKTFERL